LAIRAESRESRTLLIPLRSKTSPPLLHLKPSLTGWFYLSYNLLKVRKKLGFVAILRLTATCLCPLKTRTSIAFGFTSKYLFIAKASERVLYSNVKLSKIHWTRIFELYGLPQEERDKIGYIDFHGENDEDEEDDDE
jgi:hypothetical protein